MLSLHTSLLVAKQQTPCLHSGQNALHPLHSLFCHLFLWIDKLLPCSVDVLIVTSLFVLEICTVITVRFLMIARNNHICYNMFVELHMYSLSLVICAKIITYCKEYRQIPLTHGSQYRQILASFLLNRFCCVLYVCIKICRLLMFLS